ncbi:hypothetical protein CC86DRAFT_420802 [Ophiobolus disseminans]|uniref:Ecp2 effector protein domain-containing protein n=1 Tax=Ophiobolus disseminans TaxID=1469910 RepID=A0A6A6ZVF2_9PLEO|nr:hypothetical protein CC86DRAFT_420802 [Ophiobolus disseminans]
MIISFSAVLALSTLAFANTYITRGDEPHLNGSCKSTVGIPTEEQYIIGYNAFCDKYVNANGPRPDKYHYIAQTLRATYDLKGWGDKLIRWVFKVTCDGEGELKHNCLLNNTMCKTRLRTVIESDDTGGLGGAYCVVDNTGGEGLGGRGGKQGMSGEGQVLVMEGKLNAWKYVDRPHSEGWLTYHYYRRVD